MNQYYETHYGRNPTPARTRAVAMLLAPRLGAVSRWLDVGCGNLDSCIAVIDELRRLGVTSTITVEGWDISDAAVQCARQRGYRAEVRDIAADKISDADRGAYDVVLFMEVIEHLVDTDAAIRNVHSLLVSDGLMILSTPNLASWYNRILLLLGFQPHGTEVSYARQRFGCQFLGRLLGEVPGVTDVTAGHLRIFTFRALREFLNYHGFKITVVRGVSNHRWDLVGRLVSRIWPAVAGDVAILATSGKKEET